tara:strand:+ start:3197 stop:3850 length:654 start_codon:yes stop_codon:yes gene_type:complete
MLNLKNVTLVCVTSVNVDRAIKALNYSKKGINFHSTILFTDKDVNSKGILTTKIPTLNYIDYSRFIVYELHKFISTDYVLIIQDDGFVINPEAWNDEFFKYDYIGAPFPVPNQNDKVSYRDPFNNLVRVGNGGFSLRSKKILSLATKLDLEWKPYFGFWNEDGFFAVHNKHRYEEEGCIFAPVSVAVNFSIESSIPESAGITPFGFHGKNNKAYQLL